MYTIGAVKNAELARTLYPDWTCLFYCSRTVPTDILNKLSSMNNVVIRSIEGDGDKRSAVCRFFPAEEDGIEYMISRDCDSRLSMREVLAVNDWMRKDTDLHVMRDHPHHGGFPIPAGMWGVRGGVLKGIKKAAESFTNKHNPDYKAQDQDFLASWVWPKLEGNEISATIHDPIFLKRSFPEGAKRNEGNGGVWFVGQIFDENDKYSSISDIEVLIRYGYSS
jgi:hypothetical protein